MADRAQVELELGRLRQEKEEAEAEAGHAAEALMKLCSGITPLQEVDAAQVRAVADTYASAIEHIDLVKRQQEMLRRVLM